jgi:methylase of polypeptide subunit release factors
MTVTALVATGPRAVDPEAIELLRTALTDARYDQEGLAELGIRGPLRPDGAEEPYHELLLGSPGRLGILVRLFQLGSSVDADEAAEALAPAPVDRLAALGLLERDATGVHATAAILPTLGVLLVSDWEPERGAPARADHVLSATSPSRISALLAVREQVDAALDIGTGSGIQALLASPHARRVVATDVNPRALEFTRLNARLNAIGNVETREGSLVDPVAGETFDLIYANPPYVLSPEQEFVFRDSGLPGDSFCEALVRSVPRHLREGGIAHLLVSWVHAADGDWTVPLHAWVDGSGCDALLLHHSSQEPLVYANEHNRIHAQAPATYRRTLERWAEYYRELGIERIGWGAVLLRKRGGGRSHLTALHVDLTACGPAGGHVRRLFRAQEALERLGTGDRLLRAVLRLAEDARLEQTIAFRDGQGMLERARLRLDGGLRLELELDPQLPKLLSLLDSGNTVGAAVGEAAQALGGDGPGADQVAAAALQSVRLLLELGFLVQADGFA